MSTTIILAIAAGLAGTLGSIITAFGANKTLKTLRLAVSAHDFALVNLLSKSPMVPLVTGLDRQHDRAGKYDMKVVWMGVTLLAAGFILQALSFFLLLIWLPRNM